MRSTWFAVEVLSILFSVTFTRPNDGNRLFVIYFDALSSLRAHYCLPSGLPSVREAESRQSRVEFLSFSDSLAQ